MEDIFHQLTSESLSDQDKRHLWENIIKDQQSSGLKQAEYCRRHTICQHKFSYHLKQYRRRSEHNSSNRFLPISITSPSVSQTCLKLIFPSGFCLEFSPEIPTKQLKDIISSLRGAGC